MRIIDLGRISGVVNRREVTVEKGTRPINFVRLDQVQPLFLGEAQLTILSFTSTNSEWTVESVNTSAPKNKFWCLKT